MEYLNKIEKLKNKIIEDQYSTLKSFKTNYLTSLYFEIKNKESSRGLKIFDEKDLLSFIKSNNFNKFDDSVEDVKKELLSLFEKMYKSRTENFNYANKTIDEFWYIQHPIARERGVPFFDDETIFEKIFKPLKLKKEVQQYRNDDKYRERLGNNESFLKSYFNENKNYNNLYFIVLFNKNIKLNLKQNFHNSLVATKNDNYISGWNSYSIPTNIKSGCLKFIGKIEGIFDFFDNKNTEELLKDYMVDRKIIEQESFELLYYTITDSITLARVHQPAPESGEKLMQFSNLYSYNSKFSDKFKEYFINRYNPQELAQEKIEQKNNTLIKRFLKK